MESEEIRRLLAEFDTTLAEIARQVSAMHAELEAFRPFLAVFKPNGGGTEIQRAGMVRKLRAAARGGGEHGR